MSLPPWTPEFVRQVVAQALGTLLAALVLFLLGALAGVFQDVSLDQSAWALGALSAAVGGLWALALVERRAAKFKMATVQEALEGLTDDELVTLDSRLDPAKWNNLSSEEQARRERLLYDVMTRRKPR